MTEQEALALYRMFWMVVGLPLLIICNATMIEEAAVEIGKLDERIAKLEAKVGIAVGIGKELRQATSNRYVIDGNYFGQRLLALKEKGDD